MQEANLDLVYIMKYFKSILKFTELRASIGLLYQ